MSKIPEFLPEFDSLTDEQEHLVTSFVSEHFANKETSPASYAWLFEEGLAADHTPTDGAQVIPLSVDKRRIIAYKILTARKWDPTKAAEMLRSSVEWREKNNYHRRPFFPSPIVINGYDDEDLRSFFKMEPRPKNEELDRIIHRIRPHYSCNFHKWDKAGHPVIIELIGKIDAPNAIKAIKNMVRPGQPLSQPVAEMHSFQNELANFLIRYQDDKMQKRLKATGSDGTSQNNAPPSDGPVRRVTSMTAILDARGLSMSMLSKEGIDIIKTTLALDQANYPELLHRCFIVNCPPIIMFAYNIIKGAIDPRVRTKITFCNEAQTPETLLKVIDEDCLPAFLGGKCECSGGCVCQTAQKSGEEEDLDSQNDFVKTEEVKIAAGGREARVLEMKKGEKIAWEWDSVKGNTAEFFVDFIPTDLAEYKTAHCAEIERLTAKAATDSEAAHELKLVEEWGAFVERPNEEDEEPETITAASIVPPHKAINGIGAFTAFVAGKLVVTWSNEFSWMKGKKLRFRLIREEPAH